MQLDKTRIAVRERSMLDTLDLSLHVLRIYAIPLAAAMAIMVIPFMLIDFLVLGWMADQLDEQVEYPLRYFWELPPRYVWHLSVQVFLQAPLASALATAFLGQAVFLDRPRLREVSREIFKPIMLARLLWCHVVVRGVGLGLLLAMAVDRHQDFDPALEGFFLVMLCVYAMAVRAFRPFINEIVLLERNPLRSTNDKVMTVGRRSSMLHTTASNDLVGRWLGSAIIAVLLVMSIYGSFLFLSGVLLNEWSQGALMVKLCLPLAMWGTAFFVSVFRFLSYLDARIRQEGWEVELLLRAEASRLTTRLT